MSDVAMSDVAMSDEVVFYHYPMSRGRMVHWMLEEAGAPYRHELLDLEKGEHKQAAYLAINPMGKVLAILHRGVVITETAAICTYLADAFPAKQLAPAIIDPARGTYLRWMFFGAGCVDNALVDRMLARPVPERRGAVGYGSFEDMANTLQGALASGPFILGKQFSAADVYLGSQVEWGLKTKSLESRPVFQEYLGRLMQRPAYQRFNAQSEPLMAQMKAGG